MGLDNGIIVNIDGKAPWTRKIAKIATSDDLFSFELVGNCYEICYWRKHWNLRNLFRRVWGLADSETTYYELSIEQLEKAIKILKTRNKENWDDDGGCFFEYSHVTKRRLNTQARKLKKLIKLKKKFPTMPIYFYDSY